MKKAVSAVFCMGVVIIFSAGFVSAGVPAMKVNVPFDFYAGDQVFPAGEYQFDLNGSNGLASNVLIRSASGNGLSYVQTLPAAFISQGDFQCRITFTQYGDRFFLSKLENAGVEVKLPKSRSEEQLKLSFLLPAGSAVASGR